VRTGEVQDEVTCAGEASYLAQSVHCVMAYDAHAHAVVLYA